MPLNTLKYCRQAILLGDEHVLSKINNHRIAQANRGVCYTKAQYKTLASEALKKFKHDERQLKVVKENIDFSYLPKDVNLAYLCGFEAARKPKSLTSIDDNTLGIVMSMLGKQEAVGLALANKTFNARQQQLYAQELRDGIQALHPNARPELLWNNPLNRKPRFWNIASELKRELPELCDALYQVPVADQPDAMKAWQQSVDRQLKTNDHQALYIASRCGHIETVDLLLNAYPNDRLRLQALKANNHGALRCAVINRHLEMVRFLFKAYPSDGHRLEALKDRNGPLICAIADGFESEVLAFLQKEERRITHSPYQFFLSSSGPVETSVQLGNRTRCPRYRSRQLPIPDGVHMMDKLQT